jgi:hypothetical protein
LKWLDKQNIACPLLRERILLELAPT